MKEIKSHGVKEYKKSHDGSLKKFVSAIVVLALCVVAYGAIHSGVQYTEFTNVWIAGDGTSADDLNVVGTSQFTGNVNVTGTITSSGAQEINGDITLQNDEKIGNSTDGQVKIVGNDAANTLNAEILAIKIYDDTTLTTDGQYYSLSFLADDSTGSQAENATIDAVMDDITTATEDAALRFGVMTAGTFANELRLDGAALEPFTDAGLNLGASAKEFQDLYIDGTAYLDALNANGYLLVMGTGTIASGATSKTVTVANTDTDDLVIVTANETPTNAVTLDEAIPGTGSIAVHCSADPGASNLTFTYMVWQD